MRHSRTQTLLDHWRQARGEQIAPKKSEIVPREIKDHLAFAFLLRKDDDERFTFALAGTGFCDLFGRELRDGSFLHLWTEPSRNAIRTALGRVTNLSVPTVAACTGETADLRAISSEVLLLPYASDRGETNWILGHFQSLEPLSRLLGHKLVRMHMTTSALLTGDVHGPNVLTFSDPKRRDARHLRVV